MISTYGFSFLLLLMVFVIDETIITFISLNFSPWDEAPYKDAAEKTALGGLSLDGFLSEVCMY